jgi:hypothetical protein
VDPRVRRIAEGAAKRLAEKAPSMARTEPEAIRIERITIAQLASIACSLSGDPLVNEVCSALQKGKPVFFYMPTIEKSLNLDGFSPEGRSEIEKLLTDLAGKGVSMSCDKTDCDHRKPTCSDRKPTSSSGPESDILSDILGEVRPEDHPCYVEPGVLCFGCGRCKTLGF